MAYADLLTVQTLNTGDVLTAALMTQSRNNEEFLIDPPAASVFNSAAVSVASSVTLAALSADSENYDNNAMHSTSVNTSRITIQTAGRYEVGTVLSFAANATGNRATAFRVNGVTDYTVDLRGGFGTNTNTISGSRTLVLAAADYVEVFTWQNSGGALNITLAEFYAIFRTR